MHMLNNYHSHTIHTYFGSRTEDLSEILLQHMPSAQQRRAHPFSRTHIVVPNSGMQRYLELSIAQRCGICSHIDMSFASRFLQARYRDILPEHYSRAHLDTRQITFAILNLWNQNRLPSVFDDTPLPALLQQYSTARQRYHLAENIARLFSQYLNERPELICAWQRGGSVHSSENRHEEWQMHLFNALQLGDFSGTDVQQQFHTALAENQYDIPDVHLFGFHAMPPVQLADFAALSTQANVYAYIFNPSVAYWQDIVPESVKMEKELTAESEAALMTVGNPLLATWGQAGKYLIEQLNESDTPPFNVDEQLQEQCPIVVDSVLAWVQSSVRDWHDDEITRASTERNSELQTLANREINSDNCSISLHAGASPRREIEILYDNLCQLFTDNVLNPSDVLVMMPNLRDYAPHIQSVFGAASTIPFSLANQTAAEADPDTQAFLALLTLINNDFSAQSLFDVISEAHIRERFELSLADIETIRYWLTESRYAKHYRDDSNGRAGSLEKLLDALLLACVGGDDCEVDCDGRRRVALPAYQSSQRESLLSFCRLLTSIAQFARIAQQQRSISQWRDTFVHIAYDFLGERNTLTPRLQQWHDSIVSAHTEEQHEAITTALFDYDTVTADIIALLESEELHGPFLSGGVSFCAMVPMRSIPSKMICLLGLNQSFPRIVAKDPLDLRAAAPLWSDRDINKEYKYFFLETLMATRERLYLSHVGKDDKTGEAIPPSVMVDELFAFIERHCPDYRHAACKDYPLQGFLQTEKVTYQSLYQPPESDSECTSYPHVDNNDVENSDISENATPTLPTQMRGKFLADSLCEPFQLHLKNYLGSSDIDVSETGLAEHDMISLDSGLDKWRYKDALLQSVLFDVDAVADLIQQNRYPPTPISEPLLERAHSDSAVLVAALRPWVEAGHESHTRFIEAVLHGDDTTLDFHVLWESQYLSNRGQWQYSAGANNAKKTMRLWVNHVLQSCVEGLPDYHSHLFTLEKGIVTQTTFAPFDNVGVARSALSDMLACFQHVFCTPYAATLTNAAKKSPATCVYERADYPLFPRLAAEAQFHEASMLNEYFAPVDALMSAHLSTTEIQS